MFPVENGVAADVVLFHDHETGEVRPEASDGSLGWVVRHGLRYDL